jgi:hypothetical protein
VFLSRSSVTIIAQGKPFQNFNGPLRRENNNFAQVFLLVEDGILKTTNQKLYINPKQTMGVDSNRDFLRDLPTKSRDNGHSMVVVGGFSKMAMTIHLTGTLLFFEQVSMHFGLP